MCASMSVPENTFSLGIIIVTNYTLVTAKYNFSPSLSPPCEPLSLHLFVSSNSSLYLIVICRFVPHIPDKYGFHRFTFCFHLQISITPPAQVVKNITKQLKKRRKLELIGGSLESYIHLRRSLFHSFLS